MKIIINNSSIENNHLKEISELFVNSESVFIAVAFLKMSGLNLLIKEIKSTLKKEIKIVIVCGLDFYITEPSALKELYAIKEIYPNLSIKIFKSKNYFTFHPKVYKFNQKNKITLIVGSANLTKGGLVDNTELSLINTIEYRTKETTDLTNWENSILKLSEEINELNISEYTRKYQINHKNIKDAQIKSKKEESFIFILDLQLLEKFKNDIAN